MFLVFRRIVLVFVQTRETIILIRNFPNIWRNNFKPNQLMCQKAIVQLADYQTSCFHTKKESNSWTLLSILNPIFFDMKEGW